MDHSDAVAERFLDLFLFPDEVFPAGLGHSLGEAPYYAETFDGVFPVQGLEES